MKWGGEAERKWRRQNLPGWEFLRRKQEVSSRFEQKREIGYEKAPGFK